MPAPEGRIETVRCDCFGSNSICYIVSHPRFSVRVSYPTEAEAQLALYALREALRLREV